MEQPLAGVVVVELATGIAGPYAGKLLADYGADVIKVEPPGGDPSRNESPRPGLRPDPERSPLFLHLNRNKRSVVADPLIPEDRELLRSLVLGADVVLESGAPGDWTAHGLGPKDLLTLKDDLVVTSVTPFGQTGPYAGRQADELTTYAMAGPMNATGVPDREPSKLAGNILQYQHGTVAALSTLSALLMSEQAGHGTHVDVAGFEVQASSIDRRLGLLLNYHWRGVVSQREGGHRVGRYPVGMFPTLDGYCQVVFAPNWLDRAVEMVDHEPLTERFGRPGWLEDDEFAELMNEGLFGWTLGRSKQEAMVEAQARNLAVTPLNSTTDVLADEHFRQRGFWAAVDHPVVGAFEAPGPQFRLDDGWKQRRPSPTLGQHDEEVRAAPPAAKPIRPWSGAKTLPLEGVRVLDLTVVWAGPLCTTLLGDLGAEVIRLDNPNLFPTATRGAIPRPPAGREADFGPLWGAFPDGDAGARPWNRVGPFVCHSRGKKGVTLDLRTELGRDTFLKLVDESDVLVENNSAKVLDQLNLGWDVLHERNPRLTAVRMPSLGLHGPYADYVGFGAHMEALCGLSSLRGYQDLDASSLDATYFMDPASGAAAAFAVMAALRRREATGEGSSIEMAQAENLLSYIGEYLVDASITGVEHERHGNRHPHRAPQGVYPCAGENRWIALSIADDDQWETLVRVMGGPTWAIIPELATESGRRDRHDEIDEHLIRWSSAIDRDELVTMCLGAGLDAGSILDEAELVADPHVAARGFMRPNNSADVPTTLFPGHMWRWDEPPMVWGPLNVMGGANDEVLRGVAGLSDAEMATLEAEGHLADGYVDAEGHLF